MFVVCLPSLQEGLETACPLGASRLRSLAGLYVAIGGDYGDFNWKNARFSHIMNFK